MNKNWNKLIKSLSSCTLAALLLISFISLASARNIKASVPYISVAKFNINITGNEQRNLTPTPTARVKPTSTPIPIPPPADPAVRRLMVGTGVLLVIVVIIGIWINRRQIFR